MFDRANYKYREYRPSSLLREHIKCYWTFEGPIYPDKLHQRIMPHGGCELTVHFGDLFKNLSGQASFIEPRVGLFGPNLSASLIQGLGKSQTASIRFTPDGFYRLFRIPVKHFTNRFLEMDAFREVVKERFSCDEFVNTGFDNIIPFFDKFLTNQLKQTRQPSSRITYAVQYIQQADTMPEIGALPGILNMSARTFELQFLQQVGFSAKKYAEIVRFNRVLWSLFAGKKPVLTDLALEQHYYDQSHFINSFRKITQLTPSEFLSRHKGGFFFE